MLGKLDVIEGVRDGRGRENDMADISQLRSVHHGWSRLGSFFRITERFRGSVRLTIRCWTIVAWLKHGRRGSSATFAGGVPDRTVKGS